MISSSRGAESDPNTDITGGADDEDNWTHSHILMKGVTKEIFGVGIEKNHFLNSFS